MTSAISITPNPAQPAGPLLGSEIGEITPIGLTPAQTGQWQDTMSLMAWTCPGFRHLFYKLLANNDGAYGAVPTKEVPVAATDARNILINPDTFFGYTLQERVFIMGHEVVHNVYGDVEWLNRCIRSGVVPMDDGTTLPCREGTLQKAMDFRINALLRDSKIGKPPKDVLLDDTIATANDGVADVYRRVYDDEENNGGKKVGGKSFDLILKPGAGSGGGGQTRNQQQWQVEVAAASKLEAMKSQGKGHGSLNRFFEKVLNPVVPWTDHIRGIFNRKVGSGSYNWKKPDRRLIMRDIFMPSRSGNGAGWIVCWGDTSGSIGKAELCSYMAELASIVDDCKPTRITVLWCDDEVHKVDEIEEAGDLETIKHAGTQGGGGGTSVHPVLEWIDAQGGERPEVFIGFTDGCVTFPAAMPDIPVVIWAMTTEHKAPWGEVVRINPEK